MPHLFASNASSKKNPLSQGTPLPRKLKALFWCSLGIWLCLFGLWLYKSSVLPPGPTASQNNSPGEKIFLQSAEDWMSITFNNQKIGYSHTVRQRSSKGYHLTEDLFLQLMVLGVPRQVNLFTHSFLSPDFLLKSFQFKMVSGYLAYGVHGVVEGSDLKLSGDLLGQPQTQTIRLKEPPQLSVTLPYQLYRLQMKPGEKTVFSLFDPVLMAPKPMTITAGPTEVLNLESESRPGQRFEMDFLGTHMMVWIDYMGRVLKEEGLMGFRLIRTSREKAVMTDKGLGPDLAAQLSIPIQNPPNPETIKKLTVRLSQGPEKIPQTQGRQTVLGNQVIIAQEELSPEDKEHLPYPRGDMNPYLSDHPSLTLNDSRLKEALKEALGKEQRAQQAARRLNTWVFQHLRKRPTLSIPRAVEILAQREGDCNEHATLLLALLRAAGIPSRMALGVTLVKDRFYYHAWVEAYLGRKWISLDPTFNQFPADVTHLKLAEGMEEGLASLLPVIGKLKIEIETAL